MDYSDNLTDEQKIDIVLDYLTKLRKDEPKTSLEIAGGLNPSRYDEITEILLKIVKDGYGTTSNNLGLGWFASNFDGKLFLKNGGYVAKAIRDAAENIRLAALESRQTSLQTTLNVLTAIIAFGTLVAAAYYGIEVWKFFHQ